MQTSFFQYVQLLSFITAVFCYKGLRFFKITAFIPLLFMVCLTESAAVNLKLFGWTQNYSIYNYFLLISTAFNLYLIDKMLDLNGFSKIVYCIITSLSMLFLVLNFVCLQGSNVFNTYSFILSMLVVSTLSFLVLLKLFNDDESSIMLHFHPYFWISAATLLFSAAALIVLGLQQFILTEKLLIGKVTIYKAIMPILNVVMYLSYTYAFILCRRLANKSL